MDFKRKGLDCFTKHSINNMEAIKILQEIREQIEKARDYNNRVEITYNKAYYTRINRALLELEHLVYKNMTVGEVLDNKGVTK